MLAHEEEVKPGQDILSMLASSGIPEIQWDPNDDLCDCTFPRAGMWTNPYIARTLKVRLCCIWAELYKMFPQHVQEIPAFMDYRKDDHTYDSKPWEWDGETEMPRYLWHRQLSVQTGLPLSMVRDMVKDEKPPQGQIRPVIEGVPFLIAGSSGRIKNEVMLEVERA